MGLWAGDGVVVVFTRLNLFLHFSLSAVTFCSRDRVGMGVLVGDGVDGVAVVAVARIVVLGVVVGVGAGDGVGGIAGSAHSVVFGVDVGVLAGDGVGGIAGSAQSVVFGAGVGVLAGDGVGGIAGSAHSVVSSVDVGVLAGGEVDVDGGGVLSWSSSASIASAKNLSSPSLSVALLPGLRWPKPPRRMSVLWFGMKSAFESYSSRLLSVVRLSSLSLSLKRVSAAIARP